MILNLGVAGGVTSIHENEKNKVVSGLISQICKKSLKSFHGHSVTLNSKTLNTV